MQPSELYTLDTPSDHPLYEGFAYRDFNAPSLLGHETRDDDIMPGFVDSRRTRKWQQPLLREAWQPIEVIGNVAGYQDFTSLSSMPVFSLRACKILGDFLDPNGELLPLKSHTTQPYLFYNITTIVDALNLSKSRAQYFDDPPTVAISIDHFAFHTDRLDGLTSFRIPDDPMTAIVSDLFVQRVLDADLLESYSVTSSRRARIFLVAAQPR